MKKVKILDCTLRDGGYLNNWCFGEDTISSILLNLYQSGVDYIECGFLKDCEQENNRTFFSSVEKVQ